MEQTTPQSRLNSTEKPETGSFVTYEKEPGQVFIYKRMGSACYLYRTKNDYDTGKHAYAPGSSSKKIRPHYETKEDVKSPFNFPKSTNKTFKISSPGGEQNIFQPTKLIKKFDEDVDIEGILILLNAKIQTSLLNSKN